MTKRKEFSPSTEQQKIIDLRAGKHLVLAPPGTGKTELLAQRVDRALSRGIKPSEMICLTFTNRAANGMRERIEKKHPKSEIFIENLHSYCSKFIHEAGLVSQNSALMDEEDANLLMQEAVYGSYSLNTTELLKLNTMIHQQQLGLPDELIVPPNWEWLLDSKILRNEDNQWRRNQQIDEMKRTAHVICKNYRGLKNESDLLDFDDLLTLTYHHLQTHSNLPNPIGFHWMQVDEVQDLNPLQWAIIDRLSRPDAHRVFFGDYEQSIFSFMGSKLEKLHEMERVCEIHNLQKNFRSPSYLLNLYVEYAEHHLSPKWKKPPLSNISADPSPGALMIIETHSDSEEEAKHVVKLLPENLKVSPNDKISILVRTNNSADIFSRQLELAGIEHFKISGFDLFRRKMVKDLIAFLSCLIDNRDKLAWSRLFSIFGGLNTLQQSRLFVNGMLEAGLLPTDFTSSTSLPDSSIKQFLDVYSTSRIVVFDTETTGLNTATDDIIQIAAIEIVNGKLGETFEVYMNTDKSLAETEPIHQISKAFLKDNGISASAGLSRFIEFVGNSAVVAHNLDYDYNILLSNLSRHKQSQDICLNNKCFDTLDITKRCYPKLQSYKLEKLLVQFELEGANSHNALDDVKATANLIQFLIAEMNKTANRQRLFYRENAKELKRFGEQISPVWKKLHSNLTEPVSLPTVVNLLMKHLEPMSKTAAMDQKHLAKLIRHMEQFGNTKPLLPLLEASIPQYKRFKEVDLVIGDEKVLVATVHKAKGLEFDTVIIPECVNGIYPWLSSKMNEEVQEDSRLLYVAMTRAKKKLIITSHAQQTNQYGRTFQKELSGFVDCIKHRFEIQSI